MKTVQNKLNLHITFQSQPEKKTKDVLDGIQVVLSSYWLLIIIMYQPHSAGSPQTSTANRL